MRRMIVYVLEKKMVREPIKYILRKKKKPLVFVENAWKP